MKKENTGQESVLGDMKPSRAITRLAVPATLALLAKAVYNIVDTAYIGMLGSDIALAAVGVTLPLLLIMVSVENIFAAGAAVLAGRQLGAGHKKEANRTITSVVGLSVFIGIFLCAAGILFMEPLLRAFGASEAVLPQAGGLRILDVCGGPCQSSGPEYELRGQGGIICKNLIHRCCGRCCS